MTMISPILLRATAAGSVASQTSSPIRHTLFIPSNLKLQFSYPPIRTLASQASKPADLEYSKTDTINPPPTTRPAPLQLPDRSQSPSAPRYYLSLGKAYLSFYKTGLKNILANRRICNENPHPSEAGSRGRRDLILTHARYRHDIKRLPIFALLLLICGEFTPLVVLLIPKVVPLTCRIPKQVDLLLGREENNRKKLREGFQGRGNESKDDERRVAGLLGIQGYSWLPLKTLSQKLQERIEFLKRDDEMILAGGGVDKLVGEEVRLACVARGINVLGKGEKEWRRSLERWMEIVHQRTASSSTMRSNGGTAGGAELRIRKLMVVEEEKWGDVDWAAEGQSDS